LTKKKFYGNIPNRRDEIYEAFGMALRLSHMPQGHRGNNRGGSRKHPDRKRLNSIYLGEQTMNEKTDI